jgi:hypothetical protein
MADGGWRMAPPRGLVSTLSVSDPGLCHQSTLKRGLPPLEILRKPENSWIVARHRSRRREGAVVLGEGPPPHVGGYSLSRFHARVEFQAEARDISRLRKRWRSVA